MLKIASPLPPRKVANPRSSEAVPKVTRNWIISYPDLPRSDGKALQARVRSVYEIGLNWSDEFRLIFQRQLFLRFSVLYFIRKKSSHQLYLTVFVPRNNDPSPAPESIRNFTEVAPISRFVLGGFHSRSKS